MKTYLVKVQFEAANDAEAEQVMLRLVVPGAIINDPVELETPRIEQVRAAAQARHCAHSGDEIEIDEGATLSEGEDGPWIQGWLFVPKADLDKDEGA